MPYQQSWRHGAPLYAAILRLNPALAFPSHLYGLEHTRLSPRRNGIDNQSRR
jgi:hypothetical protein